MQNISLYLVNLALPKPNEEMNEQFLVANEDMLEYLRISEPNTDENSQAESSTAEVIKPELKLRKEKEKVIIEFEKGNYDGIVLYGRRNTEDHFSLLSVVNTSPYIDSRPNEYQAPELREYRVAYLKGKKPVGKFTEFKTIVKS
ncbi:MAG TPA: hypothetical protein VIK89_09590 [Cytophagaceae bacterium]